MNDSIVDAVCANSAFERTAFSAPDDRYRPKTSPSEVVFDVVLTTIKQNAIPYAASVWLMEHQDILLTMAIPAQSTAEFWRDSDRVQIPAIANAVHTLHRRQDSAEMNRVEDTRYVQHGYVALQYGEHHSLVSNAELRSDRRRCNTHQITPHFGTPHLRLWPRTEWIAFDE